MCTIGNHTERTPIGMSARKGYKTLYLYENKPLSNSEILEKSNIFEIEDLKRWKNEICEYRKSKLNNRKEFAEHSEMFVITEKIITQINYRLYKLGENF